MRRRKDHPSQIGGFWLSRRPGSKSWYRTWYDADVRQTRGVSLGTEDFDQAQLELAAWVLQHRRPVQVAPESMPLAVTLAAYLAAMNERPSYAQAEIAVNRFIRFWPTQTIAAATTPGEQDRYVKARTGAGVNISTIARELGVLRSALNLAHRRQEISAAPPVKYVEAAEDLHADEPKGRPLSLDEMAALFNAARTVRVRRYLMILANTLCRPGAGLDLTRFQVDLERGLLTLNPPGRKQTKKFRPVVPMTAALRPWLANFTGDRYMAHGDCKVTTAKNIWRRLRAAATLDGAVNGYSFRHTMARELRARGVPAEQIELMLGHRRPSGHSSTSQIYAPYDPAYCREAVAAIDDVMRALQRLVHYPIIGPRAGCEIEIVGAAAVKRSEAA